MPQSVDESTQNSMEEGEGGWDKVGPQISFSSWLCHHSMLLNTVSGGVFHMKLEWALVNEAVKQDNDGNLVFPSGTANEQCTNVPRVDSASFWVNLLPLVQELNLSKYLDFFLLGI